MCQLSLCFLVAGGWLESEGERINFYEDPASGFVLLSSVLSSRKDWGWCREPWRNFTWWSKWKFPLCGSFYIHSWDDTDSFLVLMSLSCLHWHYQSRKGSIEKDSKELIQLLKPVAFSSLWSCISRPKCWSISCAILYAGLNLTAKELKSWKRRLRMSIWFTCMEILHVTRLDTWILLCASFLMNFPCIWFDRILDNLPLVHPIRIFEHDSPLAFQLGFHMGLKGYYPEASFLILNRWTISSNLIFENVHVFFFYAQEQAKYFIYNHLLFTIKYYHDIQSNSTRIVGFEVKPFRFPPFFLSSIFSSIQFKSS